MARKDWAYVNVDKSLDEKLNELLKKDREMKDLGIKRSSDYYTHIARKYVEEKQE